MTIPMLLCSATIESEQSPKLYRETTPNFTFESFHVVSVSVSLEKKLRKF